MENNSIHLQAPRRAYEDFSLHSSLLSNNVERNSQARQISRFNKTSNLNFSRSPDLLKTQEIKQSLHMPLSMQSRVLHSKELPRSTHHIQRKNNFVPNVFVNGAESRLLSSEIAVDNDPRGLSSGLFPQSITSLVPGRRQLSNLSDLRRYQDKAKNSNGHKQMAHSVRLPGANAQPKLGKLSHARSAISNDKHFLRRTDSFEEFLLHGLKVKINKKNHKKGRALGKKVSSLHVQKKKPMKYSVYFNLATNQAKLKSKFQKESSTYQGLGTSSSIATNTLVSLDPTKQDNETRFSNTKDIKKMRERMFISPPLKTTEAIKDSQVSQPVTLGITFANPSGNFLVPRKREEDPKKTRYSYQIRKNVKKGEMMQSSENWRKPKVQVFSSKTSEIRFPQPVGRIVEGIPLSSSRVMEPGARKYFEKKKEQAGIQSISISQPLSKRKEFSNFDPWIKESSELVDYLKSKYNLETSQFTSPQKYNESRSNNPPSSAKKVVISRRIMNGLKVTRRTNQQPEASGSGQFKSEGSLANRSHVVPDTPNVGNFGSLPTDSKFATTEKKKVEQRNTRDEGNREVPDPRRREGDWKDTSKKVMKRERKGDPEIEGDAAKDPVFVLSGYAQSEEEEAKSQQEANLFFEKTKKIIVADHLSKKNDEKVAEKVDKIENKKQIILDQNNDEIKEEVVNNFQNNKNPQVQSNTEEEKVEKNILISDVFDSNFNEATLNKNSSQQNKNKNLNVDTDKIKPNESEIVKKNSSKQSDRKDKQSEKEKIEEQLGEEQVSLENKTGEETENQSQEKLEKKADKSQKQEILQPNYQKIEQKPTKKSPKKSQIKYEKSETTPSPSINNSSSGMKNKERFNSLSLNMSKKAKAESKDQSINKFKAFEDLQGEESQQQLTNISSKLSQEIMTESEDKTYPTMHIITKNKEELNKSESEQIEFQIPDKNYDKNDQNKLDFKDFKSRQEILHDDLNKIIKVQRVDTTNNKFNNSSEIRRTQFFEEKKPEAMSMPHPIKNLITPESERQEHPISEEIRKEKNDENAQKSNQVESWSFKSENNAFDVPEDDMNWGFQGSTINMPSNDFGKTNENSKENNARSMELDPVENDNTGKIEDDTQMIFSEQTEEKKDFDLFRTETEFSEIEGGQGLKLGDLKNDRESIDPQIDMKKGGEEVPCEEISASQKDIEVQSVKEVETEEEKEKSLDKKSESKEDESQKINETTEPKKETEKNEDENVNDEESNLFEESKLEEDNKETISLKDEKEIEDAEDKKKSVLDELTDDINEKESDLAKSENLSFELPPQDSEKIENKEENKDINESNLMEETSVKSNKESQIIKKDSEDIAQNKLEKQENQNQIKSNDEDEKESNLMDEESKLCETENPTSLRESQLMDDSIVQSKVDIKEEENPEKKKSPRESNLMESENEERASESDHGEKQKISQTNSNQEDMEEKEKQDRDEEGEKNTDSIIDNEEDINLMDEEEEKNTDRIIDNEEDVNLMDEDIGSTNSDNQEKEKIDVVANDEEELESKKNETPTEIEDNNQEEDNLMDMSDDLTCTEEKLDSFDNEEDKNRKSLDDLVPTILATDILKDSHFGETRENLSRVSETESERYQSTNPKMDPEMMAKLDNLRDLLEENEDQESTENAVGEEEKEEVEEPTHQKEESREKNEIFDEPIAEKTGEVEGKNESEKKEEESLIDELESEADLEKEAEETEKAEDVEGEKSLDVQKKGENANDTEDEEEDLLKDESESNEENLMKDESDIEQEDKHDINEESDPEEEEKDLEQSEEDSKEEDLMKDESDLKEESELLSNLMEDSKDNNGQNIEEDKKDDEEETVESKYNVIDKGISIINFENQTFIGDADAENAFIRGILLNSSKNVTYAGAFNKNKREGYGLFIYPEMESFISNFEDMDAHEHAFPLINYLQSTSDEEDPVIEKITRTNLDSAFKSLTANILEESLKNHMKYISSAYHQETTNIEEKLKTSASKESDLMQDAGSKQETTKNDEFTDSIEYEFSREKVQGLLSRMAKSDHLRFEGKFEDDLPSGFGKMFTKQGAVMMGNFDKGQLHGRSMLILPVHKSDFVDRLFGNLESNFLDQELERNIVLFEDEDCGVWEEEIEKDAAQVIVLMTLFEKGKLMKIF